MTETSKPESSGLLTRAQVATGQARKREGAEAFVFAIRNEVAELLQGSPFTPDSWLQNANREIAFSNQLTAAARENPATMLGALMLGATLQLPIGGPLGQFYLTPRGQGQGNARTTVCVPMIGYRGFFELGYRSGRVGKYDYTIVRDGDTLRKGSDSSRGNWYEFEEQADGDVERNLTGVVAIAKLLNGEVAFQYMSRMQIDRRKPSTTTNTPWAGKHADAMYVKTPHRELAKFQQLTIGQALAVDADENIAEWNQHTEAIVTHYDDGGTKELPTGAIAPDEAATEAPAAPQAAPVAQGQAAAPTPENGAQRDPAYPSDAELEEMAREQAAGR